MAKQKNLDARGLTCPSPVLLVKDALETEPAPLSLRVHVDNEAARENVTRFLQSRGFAVDSTADGDDWVITATGGAAGGHDVGQPDRRTLARPGTARAALTASVKLIPLFSSLPYAPKCMPIKTTSLNPAATSFSTSALIFSKLRERSGPRA